MPDISGLNLATPDPVDFDNYQEGGEFQPPPAEGTYYVQIPDEIKFTATKEGQLQAVLNPLMITADNPTGAGYKIGFTYVSTKKYKTRNGSSAGDFLRAVGVQAAGTLTAQQYADLIGASAGRIIAVTTEWEAYDKDTDFTLKGMDKFPKNDDGTRSYKGVCPHNKKEIFARLRVKRFVSQVAAVAA